MAGPSSSTRSGIEKILEDLNLTHTIANFQEEKIDIDTKLPFHEMIICRQYQALFFHKKMFKYTLLDLNLAIPVPWLNLSCMHTYAGADSRKGVPGVRPPKIFKD